MNIFFIHQSEIIFQKMNGLFLKLGIAFDKCSTIVHQNFTELAQYFSFLTVLSKDQVWHFFLTWLRLIFFWQEIVFQINLEWRKAQGKKSLSWAELVLTYPIIYSSKRHYPHKFQSWVTSWNLSFQGVFITKFPASKMLHICMTILTHRVVGAEKWH